MATPSISFPPELLAAIDAAATERTCNRSQVVRDAVITWLRLNGFSTKIEPEPEEKAG